MDVNDPVKCPDCGLWWRGTTHRCDNGGGVSALIASGGGGPTTSSGGGPYYLSGTLSIPVQPDNMSVTLTYSDGYLNLSPIPGAPPLLINREAVEVYTETTYLDGHRIML